MGTDNARVTSARPWRGPSAPAAGTRLRPLESSEEAGEHFSPDVQVAPVPTLGGAGRTQRWRPETHDHNFHQSLCCRVTLPRPQSFGVQTAQRAPGSVRCVEVLPDGVQLDVGRALVYCTLNKGTGVRTRLRVRKAQLCGQTCTCSTLCPAPRQCAAPRACGLQRRLCLRDGGLRPGVGFRFQNHDHTGEAFVPEPAAQKPRALSTAACRALLPSAWTEPRCSGS